MNRSPVRLADMPLASQADGIVVQTSEVATWASAWLVPHRIE